MEKGTVVLFTRNGLGQAPEELQRVLAVNFLGLVADSDRVPEKILFYGEGVRLACRDSAVLSSLQRIAERGTELILCRTCLDYFGLTDRVAVGTVGTMSGILAALREAGKVIAV